MFFAEDDRVAFVHPTSSGSTRRMPPSGQASVARKQNRRLAHLLLGITHGGIDAGTISGLEITANRSGHRAVKLAKRRPPARSAMVS